MHRIILQDTIEEKVLELSEGRLRGSHVERNAADVIKPVPIASGGYAGARTKSANAGDTNGASRIMAGPHATGPANESYGGRRVGWYGGRRTGWYGGRRMGWARTAGGRGDGQQ